MLSAPPTILEPRKLAIFRDHDETSRKSEYLSASVSSLSLLAYHKSLSVGAHESRFCLRVAELTDMVEARLRSMSRVHLNMSVNQQLS